MGNKKKNPPKWTAVYPAGTQAGDEECKFFKTLARHKDYQWRSTAALVKESGLSRKRVEEIIQKYFKLGMVFQSPKNEDHWGYWERCPEMLPELDETIAQTDQNDRIKKASASVVHHSLKSRGNDFVDLSATMHLSNPYKEYESNPYKEYESNPYKEYERLRSETKKHQAQQLIADLKKFGLHCCKGSDLQTPPKEEQKYRRVGV